MHIKIQGTQRVALCKMLNHKSIFLLPQRFAQLRPQCRSSHQRCSTKKVFLEISQNSQENTCARVSSLIKLQTFSHRTPRWLLLLVYFFRSKYLFSTFLLWRHKLYDSRKISHEENCPPALILTLTLNQTITPTRGQSSSRAIFRTPSYISRQ